MRRAVFLDRDGTLIVEKHYLSDPAQVELYPGVVRALKRLQEAGYRLFIVTNQSGIGRGYFTLADFQRVTERIQRELDREGVRIEKVYFAPEAPDQPSRGRKPSPQFLFDARDEFGVDLSRSYAIGDKLLDLECGRNAGVRRSILVRTGYGAEWEAKLGNSQNAVVVPDLVGAVDWILAQDAVEASPSGAIQSGKRVFGLIPARYASTRFPGKPLALIAGKPLLQHVVERCRMARSLQEIIVATDDERIREVARKFCSVEMTRSEHPSGSDRIAEVVERLACEAVVNIQGDEPLIDPRVVDAVANALDRFEMSTAATPIRERGEYDNPNVVKVVVSRAGQALYFSRRTIPYVRDAASRSLEEQMAAFPFLKHLGIYGYRREALLRLVKWPISALERAEKLEQLRALENGVQIGVVQVDYDSLGVDVPEDIQRVETLLKG
jgi:3-deoxy-manno-octulosonate cytidylyltransferase (CMP-KDO synthetase)